MKSLTNSCCLWGKEVEFKLKHFLILALLVISTQLVSAQQVQYFIVDEEVTDDNGTSFLEFDVYAMRDVGFKLGTGQLYFNYDTTVFGQDVDFNNRLQIITDTSSALGLKIGSPAFPFYGQFIQNDNTSSRFSFSWQANFSDPCLTEMNVKFYIVKLFSVRMEMINPTNDIASLVCFEGSDNYDGLTYTACGPSDCNIQDCIANPGLNIWQDTFFCEDCRIITKADDYGMGSLRFAIKCTPPTDTVFFDVTVEGQIVIIASDSIVIDKEITIHSEIDRLITLVNEDIFNTQPLLIINDDLFINGLTIYGQSDESMIFRIEAGGSVEFLDVEIEQFDLQKE